MGNAQRSIPVMDVESLLDELENEEEEQQQHNNVQALAADGQKHERFQHDRRWGEQLLQQQFSNEARDIRKPAVNTNWRAPASPRIPLADLSRPVVGLNRPAGACDTNDWFRQRRLELQRQQAAKGARARMSDRGFDDDIVTAYIDHMKQMLAELATAAEIELESTATAARLEALRPLR